jgi:hypothetical protein
MHWPQKESIHRIDGQDAILILRQSSGITPARFSHEELSEVLRAALTTAVAALDRYCHEVLLSRIMKQTRKAESKWPKELQKISIPLGKAKAAIKHAGVRKGKGGKIRSRPMNMIRHVLQEQFHRDTLQRPDDIARALSMIGVKGPWNECGKALNLPAEKVKQRLNTIIDRRNRIVHEGDIKRFRRGGNVTLNPITAVEIKADVEWLKKLVAAIDGILP